VENLEAARSGAIEPSVCGGQTGSDRAALDWAIVHGVPHGGWWPARRTAEDDAIPRSSRCLMAATASAPRPRRARLGRALIVSIEPVLTGGSR
jgi:hypothetical protein